LANNASGEGFEEKKGRGESVGLDVSRPGRGNGRGRKKGGTVCVAISRVALFGRGGPNVGEGLTGERKFHRGKKNQGGTSKPVQSSRDKKRRLMLSKSRQGSLHIFTSGGKRVLRGRVEREGKGQH